ncbi:MAG TPA: hypothetical protein VFY93_19055 [Planctomycetota bacterium]|nr:hypothetical protein [Planctomycetota bacterium]
MLENPKYIKFSRESCVEVMCMKDIEQALEEKPDRAKTYTTKDAYGEEIECFECCPGVTVREMLALHEGKPLEYMKGPLMPYTAVVDPHTLEDLGGIQRGEATTAEAFIEVISRHARSLEERHGKGVDAALWEYVLGAQARVDLLLGDEKLEKAFALVEEMERRTAGQNEIVTRKVGAARASVMADAAALLGALEKQIEGGRGAAARADAARLAKLLKGTELADRASALQARLK